MTTDALLIEKHLSFVTLKPYYYPIKKVTITAIIFCPIFLILLKIITAELLLI